MTQPRDLSPAPSNPEAGAPTNPPDKDAHAPAAGDLPQAHVDLSSSKGAAAPGLPHERDETVGTTDGIPDERIGQAHADLEKGRQDTSRATEADQAYHRQTKKD